MTEKKRFIAVDECVMQDNEVYVVCKGGHNADVVATALNEFYERNEYLEKENQKLKEQNQRWERIACAGIHYNNILRQRSEKND